MVIFAVYNSEGCVGRCDARCHNAVGFDCECICGGAFHGVGSEIALQDRSTLTDDEILSGILPDQPGSGGRVVRAVAQLNLFDD